MASTNQDIVKYTVDVSKLDSEIKKLRKDNEDLRKELNRVDKAYKDGSISAEEYKEKTAELNDALEKNRDRAKDLANGVDTVKKASSGASAALKGLGGSLSALMGPAGWITALVAGLKWVIEKIQDYRKELKETAEMDIAGKAQRFFQQQEKDFQDALDANKILNERELKYLDTEEKKVRFLHALEDAQQDARKRRIDELRKAMKFYGDEEAIQIRIKKLEKEREDAGVSRTKKLTLEIENLKRLSDEIKKYTNANVKGMRTRQAEIDAAREKDLERYYDEAEKNAKEQAALEKSLQESIEDLKILQIKDEKDQKIAQIKLTAERQIRAVDETTKHATAENKKLAETMKKLINENKNIQIQAIKDSSKVSLKTIEEHEAKVRRIADLYRNQMKWPDQQTLTDIKNLNGLLTEEAYVLETRNNNVRKLQQNMTKALEAEAQKRDDLLAKADKEIEWMEKLGSPDAAERALQARESIIQTYEQNRVTITENANAQIEKAHLESARKIEQIEKEKAKAQMDSWIGATEGIGNVLSALAETQNENSRKQIKLQTAAIYINMATALARGVAEAVSAGFPALLATVPATIAALISQFAQIKSIQSQAQFSKGGNVWGAGTATSDSIDAKLSNGESVINAAATARYAPILSSINQSTGGNAIYSADSRSTLATEIAVALRSMPNPVVSVESIDKAQNITRTVDVLSKL